MFDEKSFERGIFKKEVIVNISKELLLNPEVSDTLLLILPYLRIEASLRGIVSTTLEYIVKRIGYVPNNQKGRINEVILRNLEWLASKEYISIDVPISKISAKKFFRITINNNNNIFDMENKDGDCQPYVILTSTEYENIIQRSSKGRQGSMLRVFLNIKKYINFNEHSAKVCFPSIKTIKEESFIGSTETVSNLVKDLEEIGVIFVHRGGAFKSQSGKIRHRKNLYALTSKNLEIEINSKYTRCDKI